MVKYIAISEFTSITGKRFNRGDSVPNGDATSMMKHLKVVSEDNFEVPVSPIDEDFKPEANKIMTKEDLTFKTKKNKK